MKDCNLVKGQDEGHQHFHADNTLHSQACVVGHYRADLQEALSSVRLCSTEARICHLFTKPSILTQLGSLFKREFK